MTPAASIYDEILDKIPTKSGGSSSPYDDILATIPVTGSAKTSGQADPQVDASATGGVMLRAPRPGPRDPRAAFAERIGNVITEGPLGRLFRPSVSPQAEAIAPFDKTAVPVGQQPLLKLSELDSPGEPQTVAQGARRGALEGVEGFTSPQGLAMIAGLGKLSKIKGVGQAITAAIGAGFDVDMISAAIKEVPEAKALWDSGQQGEAARVAVRSLMTGGLGLAGARGKVREIRRAAPIGPAAVPVQPTVAPPQSVAEQPQVAAAAASASTARPRESERGSISLRPVNQPTTPGEIYAAKQDALREAARKGPGSKLSERARAAATRVKADTVDSTATLPDTLANAQKDYGYEVNAQANISSRIDRAFQSGAIADAFIDKPIPGAGNRGLRGLVRDVDNASHLDNYLIAQHAEAVRAVHPKAAIGTRTAAEDAAYLTEFRDKVAIPATKNAPAMTYGEVSERIADYSRGVLLYAAKSGLISPELAGHLDTIYPNHVPLNRVFSAIEEGGSWGQGGKGPASLSKQTVVMKLEGSDKPVENALYSLLDKTHQVFKQGTKNEAARTLADYRDGVKDSKGVMQKSGFEGLITELQEGETAPDHLKISYLDQGVKREFKTTPEIASAAKSLDVQQIGIFAKVINYPVRVAKAGTVGFNVPFLVSNLFGDSETTKVVSKHSGLLNDPRAFMEAFLAAVPGRPGVGGKIWQELTSEGGGFTSFDQYRDAHPVKTIESIRATRSVDAAATQLVRHPIDSAGMLLRELENFVSRGEQFGRARIYAQTKRALLKEGRSEADARTMATLASNRDLPPYHLAGNAMRAMGAPFMFLNARTQGTRVDLRALNDSPFRTGTRIAARLMFPVALATVWNLSDEKRRKAYQDIRQYELDANLTFLMPNPSQDAQGRYSVLKMKLPPGMNNLTIPVRRAIETLAGMAPQKIEEMAENLFGFVSPVTGVGDILPQAIKPTWQARSNWDDFRKQPQVPGRMQHLPPEMQVQPYTSGTAKKIAGPLGASPIKVEEFIKGTLGGAGAQVLNASDRLLYLAGKIPKSDIGGNSTADALGARIGKARGGQLGDQEYEAKSSLVQDMERKAVAAARKTSYYHRVKDNEALAQRYLEAVATRARNQVMTVTTSPRYRRMEDDQKLVELGRLKTRLTGGSVPGRLMRPAPPLIQSPSRAAR